MSSNNMFKTSINIKFDLGVADYVRSYLPTPSHADSIIGISDGFSGEDNSAHIMIGPYGSGKSLLATIIANIVSASLNDNEIKTLINKYDKVHDDVYESLMKLHEVERQYIPIILNGSYHNFSETLTSVIQKELNERGIEIHLPSAKNNVLDTIELWKRDFENTYRTFVDKLTEREYSIEVWQRQIETYNAEEYEWFKEVYTELTAGAVFDETNQEDFLDNLTTIIERLEAENIGLFIIHDEFGRMLQNLDQRQIYKTMQDLQDLAEITNRSQNLLQVLLISHKNMSQYMVGFNEEHQSEFQRIEKRYTSYFVESDTATYYRIIENFVQNNNIPQLELSAQTEADFISKLRGFGLFNNLNQLEIEELIIKGANPIHPITLYLLPRISQVFGQNERTLFTYLESTDSNGLQSQLADPAKFVYSDAMFDYFFNESSINDIQDEQTKSIFKAFKHIQANLNLTKRNAYRIVKFLTMWQITNSNNIYKVDNELISFATGIDENKLQSYLDELSDMKFIRYNAVLMRWEIAEGSAVVIEKVIQDELYDLRIKQADRMTHLEKNLEKQYYLARDYNDIKNMTRFMRVKLINSRALLNEKFNLVNKITVDADGYVVFVLLDKKGDRQAVHDFIESVDHSNIIFAVLNDDMSKMTKTIDQTIAIDSLLDKPEFLAEYKNIEDELNVHKKSYSYELEVYLDAFFKFKSQVDWFYKGDAILLRNEVQLEDLISEIMFDVYPDTPVIMNDAVNRMHVRGIQERSLFKVVDHVLEDYYKENIGIEGQGPDYLIYATIIKNNNLPLTQLDAIENKELKAIRQDLIAHLESHHESKLSDLYNILIKGPYGVRKSLIPLLIIILLRDRWDQLIFSRNEMFVPALKGEKIYEMFEEAEEYDYTYHHYSDEMIAFMNDIEALFSPYISEYVLEDTQLIKVSSGLLNWLRSLPKQTQMTQHLDKQLLHVKDLIRKSEFNPLTNLEVLSDFTHGNIENLKEIVAKMEASHQVFKDHVKETLLSKLGLNHMSEIKYYLADLDENKKYNNHLVSTLMHTSDIEEFAKAYIGTELEDWSDVNYELYIKQLDQDITKLDSDEVIVNDDIIELYLNNRYSKIPKVELSTKSKVIYNNVSRMLTQAGRNISRDEMNYLLLKILDENIE